jgi:phosphocarrier protein
VLTASSRLEGPEDDVMLEDQGLLIARRSVVVLNSLGLHLRPAEKFVRLAGRFASEVRVYRDGLEVNGKSILDLAILAAGCGTRLDLEARGPDAETALAALAELVSARFQEDAEGE